MAKDPAVLFYTSDFLTGTVLMSNEQVGIYIRLLCIQHQHGRINKVYFNTIVTNNDLIRKKFIEDDRGFYNIRLEEESLRRSAYIASRSKNRIQGHKNHMINICKSHVKHMETETETEDKKRSITDKNNTDIYQSNNIIGTKPKVTKNDLTDEQFLISLKTNKAFSYINIDHELAKMDAWFLVHPKRKKTRRFVVNWLNRIEKPFNSGVTPLKKTRVQSKCIKCGISFTSDSGNVLCSKCMSTYVESVK